MPPTPELSAATVAHSLQDPAEFLRILTKRPAWEHQASVLRSKARFRAICSGRQSGKVRHCEWRSSTHAYTKAGSTTLLVSAVRRARALAV